MTKSSNNAVKSERFRSRIALRGCFLSYFGANASNSLTNLGFETGTTYGWSGFDYSISTVTVPRTGSYSYLASNRLGSWSGPSQSLLGLISDGQTCSISGWVRLLNSSSDSIGLTIQQTDDSGTDYHPIEWSIGRDDVWTELSGFFTLDVTGTLTTLRKCLKA